MTCVAFYSIVFFYNQKEFFMSSLCSIEYEDNMTRLLIFLVLIIAALTLSPSVMAQTAIIANHQCANISQIPTYWITQAKGVLHIAYGHTSHGSQLTDGMTNLVGFMNGLGYPLNLYAYNNGGTGGALDLHDYAMAGDAGYYPDWVNNTRTYLNNPANADVNVIIWSWCGQVSGQTEQSMINNYLAPMTQLELDYPSVKFVYMTGHLDGSGSSGNLHIRNQQIRTYCQTNNKILYDFADIESYDLNGLINYMELLANDNCDYDSDNNGTRDKNWATDWQNAHTLNVDWYNCSAAHSQPVNGNRKAYAAWWLWARLAGWNGATGIREQVKEVPHVFTFTQNYPNPFNPVTTIEYSLAENSKVSLKIYNVLGHEVATLVDGEKKSGILYRISFDASQLSTGTYFYRLEAGKNVQVKKLMLIK